MTFKVGAGVEHDKGADTCNEQDEQQLQRQEREAARQADPAEAPQPDVMDFSAPEPAPESGLVETPEGKDKGAQAPEKKEKPARKPRAPRKPKNQSVKKNMVIEHNNLFK